MLATFKFQELTPFQSIKYGMKEICVRAAKERGGGQNVRAGIWYIYMGHLYKQKHDLLFRPEAINFYIE